MPAMSPTQKDECSGSNTILKTIGRRDRRKWRLVPTLTFINWRRQPGFQPVPNLPWFSLERSWEGRLISLRVMYYALRLDFRHDWVAEITEILGP